MIPFCDQIPPTTLPIVATPPERNSRRPRLVAVARIPVLREQQVLLPQQ